MSSRNLRPKNSKSKLSIPKTKVNTYYAISDGKKKVYTNIDHVKGYGINVIPDPRYVSFISVFINGILQPPSLYKIQKGVLKLKSNDAPKSGVPIIIQYLKKRCKKPSRRGVKNLANLIKLLINATASQPIATGTAVTVSFTNIVSRFFSTIPAGTVNTATIPATSFTDDSDTPLGANGLPNGVPTSGYVNIYVDGVLQQGSMLTSLTDTTLILTSLPDPFTVNTPVALEVVSFENMTTNVTDPTISAPIITVTT